MQEESISSSLKLLRAGMYAVDSPSGGLTLSGGCLRLPATPDGRCLACAALGPCCAAEGMFCGHRNSRECLSACKASIVMRTPSSGLHNILGISCTL